MSLKSAVEAKRKSTREHVDISKSKKQIKDEKPYRFNVLVPRDEMDKLKMKAIKNKTTVSDMFRAWVKREIESDNYIK